MVWKKKKTLPSVGKGATPVMRCYRDLNSTSVRLYKCEGLGSNISAKTEKFGKFSAAG